MSALFLHEFIQYVFIGPLLCASKQEMQSVCSHGAHVRRHVSTWPFSPSASVISKLKMGSSDCCVSVYPWHILHSPCWAQNHRWGFLPPITISLPYFLLSMTLSSSLLLVFPYSLATYLLLEIITSIIFAWLNSQKKI